MTQDIIVIGGSAGAVEALQTVVAGLPAAFPGSIFAVLHIGRNETNLPAILSRAGPLPAVHPQDGAPIEKGRIYVAPPDHHLLIEYGHLHLERGPKENRQRPAINPLFRSAAIAYGARVAGVLLSGMLDDGVTGLWEIKRRGGVSVIQDPEEAPFPDMPRNAAKSVPIDYPVPVADMPSLLARLAREGVEPEQALETSAGEQAQQLTELSCPDCGGVMSERPFGRIREFRCTIGHAHSSHTMEQALSDAEEEALWAAVRALEQNVIFLRQFAKELWPDVEREAAQKKRQADAIRSVIEKMRMAESERSA